MPLSILKILFDLHQGRAVRSQKQTPGDRKKKKIQRSFWCVPAYWVCYKWQAAHIQITEPKTEANTCWELRGIQCHCLGQDNFPHSNILSKQLHYVFSRSAFQCSSDFNGTWGKSASLLLSSPWGVQKSDPAGLEFWMCTGSFPGGAQSCFPWDPRCPWSCEDGEGCCALVTA